MIWKPFPTPALHVDKCGENKDTPLLYFMKVGTAVSKKKKKKMKERKKKRKVLNPAVEYLSLFLGLCGFFCAIKKN